MQFTSTLNAISSLLDEAVADFETHRNVNTLWYGAKRPVCHSRSIPGRQNRENSSRSRSPSRTRKLVPPKRASASTAIVPPAFGCLTGNPVKLQSPYFAKAKSKRRLTPSSTKRKNGTGCHFGLDYLGFFSRCTALLGSVVVQAALLCPSFELARRTLQSHAIDLNVKTIRRLTMDLAEKAVPQRGRVSRTAIDQVEGKTVLVCIDGGRLRERRTKHGPKPEGRKRQGYDADWEVLPSSLSKPSIKMGKICRKSSPFYDASLGGIDTAFELLETYLRELEIATADRVVFCCDGARSYWKRIEPLAKKLNIPVHYEVIDHTHAKQNLYEIIDKLPILMPSKEKKRITDNWLNLLWEGNLNDLRSEIEKQVTSSKRRHEALVKF